jgi:hypothetical protein
MPAFTSCAWYAEPVARKEVFTCVLPKEKLPVVVVPPFKFDAVQVAVIGKTTPEVVAIPSA